MTYSEKDADIYQLAVDLRRVDGAERTRNMKEGGHYASTGPGAKIIEEIAGRHLTAIRAYKKLKTVRYKGGPTPRSRAQNVIRKVDATVLSAITVECMVNAIASGRQHSMYKVRQLIASRVAEHVRLRNMAKSSPKMFGQVQRYMGKLLKTNRRRAEALMSTVEAAASLDVPPPLEGEDSMLMGAVLLELLIEVAPDVFEAHNVVDWTKAKGRRNSSYVRFTPDFSSKIKDLEDLFAQITPLRLPITELPLDWTSVEDGGFYSNAVYRRPIMSTRSKLQLDAMRESTCPEVFKAVNTLQRTGWIINETVLQVFREAAESGWDDPNLEIPSAEPPYDPPFPGDHCVRGSDEWQVYANKKRRFHREIKEWDQRRAELGRLLCLADDYNAKDGHYLVHGIDFRGRIYPSVSILNYQGDDLARSLQQFDKALPIETQEQADWFLIQGANTWGNDKVSFPDRVRWVYKNKAHIMAVCDDPISYRWWCDADKPWCFLAWCLEAGRFLADPKPGFMSSIAVAQDGTNNGLQIYSLLLKDSDGGRATNCSPGIVPADIYQEVADLTTAKLVDKAKQGEAYAQSWLDLCSGRLPRKATKRLVMTDVYGATAYSRQRYVSEWYFDIVRGLELDPPFPGNDTYGATWWLADLMKESLSEVCSSAQNAMGWLREVGRIFCEHKIHLNWTTPTGLKIQQRYTKSTGRRVEIMCRRKVNVFVRQWTDDVLKSKSVNAFCPNYVHSLDGAAAALTTNRAAEEGITHFQMIHDSYGTHAANAPKMARILREVYADMFQGNLLEKLREELLSQLPPGVSLPLPPVQGVLNVEDLHNSPYFFA